MTSKQQKDYLVRLYKNASGSTTSFRQALDEFERIVLEERDQREYERSMERALRGTK